VLGDLIVKSMAELFEAKSGCVHIARHSGFVKLEKS